MFYIDKVGIILSFDENLNTVENTKSNLVNTKEQLLKNSMKGTKRIRIKSIFLI